jgi:hypothetical protein
MGAVKALRSLNLRKPADMTDDQRRLLGETEDAIVRVMRGKVHGSIATPVLKAAVTVRDEIVGPIAQKVDATVKHGYSAVLDEMASLEAAEKAAEEQRLIDAQKAAREAAPKGPIIRKKDKTEAGE